MDVEARIVRDTELSVLLHCSACSCELAPSAIRSLMPATDTEKQNRPAPSRVVSATAQSSVLSRNNLVGVV